MSRTPDGVSRVPSGAGVVAGIDEAGLGPMLGPLAIGWCALRVPDADVDPWDALENAVARRHARGETRLVVADSKDVYDRTERGWRRLEATALAFLDARPSADPVRTGRDLVRCPRAALAPPVVEVERHPWFASLPEELPVHLAGEDRRDRSRALRDALDGAGLEVVDAAVRLVPAGELNDSFRWTESKGRTVWTYVADVLESLWERFGEEHVHVHLDRQGGRTRYGSLLQESFPLCTVRTLRESRSEGDYRLESGGRCMTLRVTPRAEDESFAVAVGSCLAKYGREVAMEGFNTFFRSHQPDLAPTAGYVTDARRWLADAGPALERAAVPTERIVRQR